MRVLFYMGHDGFIRNFEPVLRGLIAGGHEVCLAFTGRRSALMSAARSAEDLCAELPGLSWCRAAKGRDHDFSTVEDALNTTRDYVRFHRSAYRDADKLRARARTFAPPQAAWLADLPGIRSAPGSRVLDRILRALQRLVPVSGEAARQLADAQPDVVLVTPLIGFRSRQVAAVRAARAAGIPSLLLVHSWDNMTNKGVLHEIPDRIVVWNEAQRQECVRLHDVPAHRVVVTGAQSYDHWFEWCAASDRDEFCVRVGLDPARPFVLYVCSSLFIAPDETSFVERWLAQLRANSDLKDIGVLVRPHPQHRDQWRDHALADQEQVSLWPPPDADRSGRSSQEDYYDSIHHAAAVVGINTSALIESAIQCRPVLSVLVSEFRDTQDGTLHFAHIAGDRDGFLLLGRSMDQHLGQLATAVTEGAEPERTRRFLERFVRPHGLEAAATPHVIDAIERTAAAGRGKAGFEPSWLAMARRLMVPMARFARRCEQHFVARRRASREESR